MALPCQCKVLLLSSTLALIIGPSRKCLVASITVLWRRYYDNNKRKSLCVNYIGSVLAKIKLALCYDLRHRLQIGAFTEGLRRALTQVWRVRSFVKRKLRGVHHGQFISWLNADVETKWVTSLHNSDAILESHR
jgi:hypothetical protein